MFTKEDFKEHIKQLIDNLSNIHDPKKFHDRMSFRGAPHVVIDIYDGRPCENIRIRDGVLIKDEALNQQYIYLSIDTDCIEWCVDFGIHPRSKITKQHVDKKIKEITEGLDEFVDQYYSHWKNFNAKD